ncbi:hypothetical protein [Pseudomonas sp. RT6P73]
MNNTLNIESALALDGRIFAMLTPAELELFELARAEGRKHGVIATILSAADSDEFAQANSQAHQDEIMRRMNGTVSVVRGTTDIFAEAAALSLSKFPPPRFVTITQDKSQLEQLYPKGGDGKSTVESDYEEINITAVLEQRFAVGQGVVTLSASMTDEQMLTLIKSACTWSKGKAFQVIPPQAG